MNKKLLVFLILSGIYFILVTFGSAFLCSGLDEYINKPAKVYLHPNIDELLYYTNLEREKAGVPPVKLDERLNEAAQLKADELIRENYFAHVSPSGKRGLSFIGDVAPGLCIKASENLRMNVYDDMSSYTTITGLASSRPHYEAMITPEYTLVGFGIKGKIVVQHFCQEY